MAKQAGVVVSGASDLYAQLQGLLDARVAELTAGDRACCALRAALVGLSGEVPEAPLKERKARAVRQPKERAPGERRQFGPRSSGTTTADASGALGAKLLQLLKDRPQPLRDLISLSGASAYLVKQALERLESQRLAHAEGHTSQRMWHLGALTARSAPPAKEAVQGANA